MRIQNLILAITFCITGTLSAFSATIPTKTPERIQIQSLLNAIDYKQYLTNETKVNISFFVTAQNEIVVVATDNKDLDHVLKLTLNYKKIAMNELNYQTIYTIPVSIK